MIRKIAFHNWTIGLLFAFGLMLCMSDGPFFPWPNFVGVLLCAWVAFAANVKSGILYGPKRNQDFEELECKNRYHRNQRDVGLEGMRLI